jgi:hypothetical protein
MSRTPNQEILACHRHATPLSLSADYCLTRRLRRKGVGEKLSFVHMDAPHVFLQGDFAHWSLFAWKVPRGCDTNVRFGSKADIAVRPSNVRFTPESGHCPTQL